MVERSLRMREVLVSIPRSSIKCCVPSDDCCVYEGTGRARKQIKQNEALSYQCE